MDEYFGNGVSSCEVSDTRVIINIPDQNNPETRQGPNNCSEKCNKPICKASHSQRNERNEKEPEIKSPYGGTTPEEYFVRHHVETKWEVRTVGAG